MPGRGANITVKISAAAVTVKIYSDPRQTSTESIWDDLLNKRIRVSLCRAFDMLHLQMHIARFNYRAPPYSRFAFFMHAGAVSIPTATTTGLSPVAISASLIVIILIAITICAIIIYRVCHKQRIRKAPYQ